MAVPIAPAGYERHETIASNRSPLKSGEYEYIVISVPAPSASAANLSASILKSPSQAMWIDWGRSVSAWSCPWAWC